ncbi:MAG: HAD-IC family P-type ATPase [bacterium]|nr:HAD-IC family P-type ATPase [bacterium]
MQTSWTARGIVEVLKTLGSNEQGLTREEAEKRLAENGHNVLPEAKADNLFFIFIRQFRSPLIYILLAAAAIVFAMGETTDSYIILFILIFNAIVGTIQEGKAQNTLLALKRFVETKALVLRGGKEVIIPDTEVVVGDIIILEAGEKIPADARIVEANNLKVDEAALTGESKTVHKVTDTLRKPNAAPADQRNMVFKGSHMASGNGRAVVVGIGIDTVIGKIASEIATIDTEIPLKANIRYLSRLIIAVTGAVSVFLFIVGIFTGKSAGEMFITVVSLAVSVIPEGLPIAMTLVLAAGVWRMSKRNALVKRLQAVEALGQARVIAVDKTGTLTRNEMVVQVVYVDGKEFTIGGVGYESTGEASLGGEVIDPTRFPELLYAGRLASFCASARPIFNEESREWRLTGDPTEACMFVFGGKLGFNKDELESNFPLVGEIPFDYKTKYHLTVHNLGKSKLMTVVGAPEVVMELCTKIWQNGREKVLSKKDREEMENKFAEMSRRGLRMLAFSASKKIPEDLDPEHVQALTFVGFYGIKDALRAEVKEAIEQARNAGMRIVMITGDHKITAEAIAREAGIFRKGDMVLTGAEMEDMPDIELKRLLQQVSVFARVTPEHKLRIINAYKARGEIVAMTGDGVNDAPSLVAADLGVSMGKIGTEVAKEASDIVILDDNFKSLVTAIEEGRSIYNTIKKVILYLLSTSIGEVLVISGALLASLPLPLLPAQIIWLNFVTDGFFTVALAMEPKEKGLLRGNFEKPNRYLVNALMAKRMLVMALPMMIGTLILFGRYYQDDIAKALTISLTTLAVFQWFNAWNCRSETKSIFRENPLNNIYMIGATTVVVGLQILAVYNPLFQKFLHTVPLSLNDWLLIIPVAASVLVVEEVRKYYTRKLTAPVVTQEAVSTI